MIKYQSNVIDVEPVVKYWLDKLPITHDKEEAIIMNELFCEILVKSPVHILGSQNENLHKVVHVLADIYSKKFVNEETATQISQIVKQMSSDQTLGPLVQKIGETLSQEQQEKIRNALQA